VAGLTADQPAQWSARTSGELRAIFADCLPVGFEEVVHDAMLAYVVPRSLYPAGYHANPKLPLPFVSLAGQKSGISIYHFGLYGTPHVDVWCRAEFPKHSASRLDIWARVVSATRNPTRSHSR
jgi:hypothetical protein